jgi:hypothetical protein
MQENDLFAATKRNAPFLLLNCKSQDFAGEISTHIWDGKGLNRELPERE